MKKVPSYGEKIGFHKFEQKIEIFFIAGSDDFVQFDYIRMADFLQNLNLSVCPLSINVISECPKYLFECVRTMSDFVLDFPDVSVCSTSD
jgi:hypothetical protein